MPPKLYNINLDKNIPSNAIYIGRGSSWGNPYKIGIHGNRTEVIAKFENYANKTGLKERIKIELRNKNLKCYCCPLPCHGDIILKWANEE